MKEDEKIEKMYDMLTDIMIRNVKEVFKQTKELTDEEAENVISNIGLRIMFKNKDLVRAN